MSVRRSQWLHIIYKGRYFVVDIPSEQLWPYNLDEVSLSIAVVRILASEYLGLILIDTYLK